MSILFNLDEDSNLIQRATFTQDFRDVHSKCWVLLPYPAQVDFAEGFGFIYKGQEWEAVSYKRVNREDGNSFLSVCGYPKGVCTYVDQRHNNLSSLADSVGATLAKGYTNLEFEFPLRNVPLGPLLFKYRHSSLEQKISQPEQAWFIFYDERGIMGCTYQALAESKTLLEYSMEVCNFMGGTYSFARDYLMVRYLKDHHPSKAHYKNWIGCVIGDKFDIKGVMPGLLGFRYKLSGSGEEIFNKYDKLILVRQKFDSSKSPLPWTLTFGQLLV